MTKLDRVPALQLLDKYGITESVFNERIHLLNIKSAKIGNQFYVSEEQLEWLDQLDVYLKAGRSMAELSTTSLQQSYRGRVQAQGDDIPDKGGYSSAWARMTPVTEQEGLSFLATIQSQCNKSQQAERQQAFSKAKRFVQNASKQGGIGPEAQPHSFQNTKRTVDNARVDIEIASGLTFVPEEANDKSPPKSTAIN